MPIIEADLGKMEKDYDWQEAFEYAKGFNLDDIKYIIASVEGANDYEPWVAVFKLKDNSYGYLSAWCDYTGWD